MIKCQDMKIKYRRILLTFKILILHTATSLCYMLGNQHWVVPEKIHTRTEEIKNAPY